MPALKPVPVGVLILLYGSLVAIHGHGQIASHPSLLCADDRLRGANIGHGIAVAFFAGIACALLIAFVRDWPRLVAGVFILGMAAFGVAIAFVALDSATATYYCGPSLRSFGTTTRHVYDLYYAWAPAIALLLVQAVRLLRQGVPDRTQESG